MKPLMKNSSKHSYSRHSKAGSEKHKQLQRLRDQIAVNAARLMSEEGSDNFNYARKKAAQHLGIQNEHAMPNNEEILTQLKIYQSLYSSADQEKWLYKLREVALKAMRLFKAYRPRLTGSVLLGYAGEHSSIDIQLMADTPEEIASLLMDHNIPYQPGEWKLYFSKRNPKMVPYYQFYAGEHQINLITLSEKQRKNRPVSPLNGQSMPRASIEQLEALLNTPEDNPAEQAGR